MPLDNAPGNKQQRATLKLLSRFTMAAMILPMLALAAALFWFIFVHGPYPAAPAPATPPKASTP